MAVAEIRDLIKVLQSPENIQVTELNCDCIIRAIAGLQNATKSEIFRCEINQNIIGKCCDILKKKLEINSSKQCTLYTNIFRFLRNCCVNSIKNQEYIINVLPVIIEILEEKFDNLGENDLALVKLVMESGVQLVGNLVAANENNQNIVWERCFPTLFQKIMDSSFVRARDFISMVIYNCIRLNTRLDLVTTPEGTTLIKSIVQMCCGSDSDVEWGILCINSLLDHGTIEVYESLPDYLPRIFLLNMIEERLEVQENWDSWLSLDDISHFSEVLKGKMATINCSETDWNSAETSDQIIFIVHLLRLICFLTSFPEKCSELRNKASLLEYTIACLRATCTDDNKKFFSNSHKFPTGVSEHPSRPTFGFKKCLVQLIGNMCYKNKINQDLVRKTNCIPLILDSCNIDDNNPYICQWAILSLRNILENNLENQNVVKSLEKLGLAKNKRLLDEGLMVTETAQNKIKVESIKRS